MIRRDITVKRPEGTKLYHKSEGYYVYYVISKEYKKEKQYVIEKRACIGKMKDDETMNPNDNYFRYCS